jgi:hypothetical protein
MASTRGHTSSTEQQFLIHELFRSFLIEAVDVFVCSLLESLHQLLFTGVFDHGCYESFMLPSAFAASNLDSDRHKKFRSSELQITHSDEIMRDHKEYLLAHYSDESVPVRDVNQLTQLSVNCPIFQLTGFSVN